MSTDAKSNIVGRILFQLWLAAIVPVQFLGGLALWIWAYIRRPESLMLAEFGLRIITVGKKENMTCEQVELQTALRLLGERDQDGLKFLKEHIPIIYLWTDETKGAFSWKRQSGARYMGSGVCFLNLHVLPGEISAGARAANIINWLMFEASRVHFSGKLGAYFPMTAEDLGLSQEECRQVLTKLSE